MNWGGEKSQYKSRTISERAAGPRIYSSNNDSGARAGCTYASCYTLRLTNKKIKKKTNRTLRMVDASVMEKVLPVRNMETGRVKKASHELAHSKCVLVAIRRSVSWHAGALGGQRLNVKS